MNNNNMRLRLQVIAGTLLLEVCSNGIAPTLAAGMASTTLQGYSNKPVAIGIGNDCTEALPSSRTESFVKAVSPLAEASLLEVCSNGRGPTLAAGLASTTLQGYINKPVALDDDCTEALPPNTKGSLIKAVSSLPEGGRIEGLKASNPKSSLLRQKSQVANNTTQAISQLALADANSLPILDQPLNSQLPSTINQATQDLCEVGLGDAPCDVGGGEFLCEVGGEPPAIGGGEPPPVVAAGGGGGLGFLGALPLLGLVPLLTSSDSSPDPDPSPPSPPPPKPTPPKPTPPPAVPEPSESLAALVAIGIGALMKRKYSKISSRKAAKTIDQITQNQDQDLGN